MIDRIQIIRQAHAKAKAEKLAKEGAVIDELLPVTKEDVLDEAEHLDALDHVKEVDFDHDENEVNMDTLSPAMREMYNYA
jgi:hypothetical protein